MAIEFICFRCDRRLRAKDDAAGKSMRCPSCGAEQQISRPSNKTESPRKFTRDQARARVLGPAIGMIVCAVLQAAVGLFSLFVRLVSFAHQGLQHGDATLFAAAALPLLLTLFVIFGAVRMMMLRTYTLAITTSVVSLFCGVMSLVLPMVFGIWALIVLCDRRVREHFG